MITRTAGRSAHLVAFYSGPGPLEADDLRHRLSRSLPPYMVPSSFHWQESLPLTANGKIDKKALTALAEQLDAAGPPEATDNGDRAPQTPTEQRLAAAWAPVLGVPQERVGRLDHFFDHGGTSLTAVKLVVSLDRVVSLKDITRHPVLADLAALVDERAAAADTADAPSPRNSPLLRPVPVPDGPQPVGPQDGAVSRHDQPSAASVRPPPERKPTMPSSLTTTLPGLESRPGRPPVLELEPGTDTMSWPVQQRDALRAAVAEHGAVLVRGLGLRDSDDVAAVLRQLATGPAADKEAFALRETYSDGVYSSTAWPSNQPMCMHHELSYTQEFPGLMMFACLTAPTEGGATAVADSAAVLDDLPPALTERFEREGWLLTRSYNDEIGASVAEAFGTEDRVAVENYCRANAIEFAWQPDGGLRTRQLRSAVVRHPVTGMRCWFNQIAFLNEWTTAPEVREYLIDEYGADGLPFNTRYGNGDPLTEDTVQLINAVYETHTARQPWLAGDLLLVDNIRTAHSREPFEGPRDVVVAMADPVRLGDCSPTVEAAVR